MIWIRDYNAGLKCLGRRLKTASITSLPLSLCEVGVGCYRLFVRGSVQSVRSEFNTTPVPRDQSQCQD